MNIHECHLCEKRSAGARPFVCLADPGAGTPVDARAAAGDCPLGRFARRRQVVPPGYTATAAGLVPSGMDCGNCG